MSDEDRDPTKDILEAKLGHESMENVVSESSPDIGGANSEIHIHETDWTRVEGVIGGGAVLTAVINFVGMELGQAIGAGFGLVMLADFINHRRQRRKGE